MASSNSFLTDSDFLARVGNLVDLLVNNIFGDHSYFSGVKPL
jgi:hypothetical protein